MVDYIGRALVADALRDWRRDLEGERVPSLLRDLSASEGRVLDLEGAHPSGLAQLFAERPTLVSSLFREADEQARTLTVARAILDQVEAARLTAGVATGGLVVGTLAWVDGQAHRSMPLLLRPTTFEAARGDDVQITLHHTVALNPVAAAELKARVPERAFDALVRASLAGPQFDPRPLWNEVRGLKDAFGEDLVVDELLLLGSFDDPEQRLLDDLDECSHLIASNAVLAAVAGDRAMREELVGPVLVSPPGDRDPFSERGIGELDDVEFAALDLVATGRSVFLQAPPGADPVRTAVAIAADGAASGKVVGIVGGSVSTVVQVAEAIDSAGIGEIAVNGSDVHWNTAARTRLLESMTASTQAMDEAQVTEAGERLLEARAELRARFDELHRNRDPWEVSAYRAVQEIVRLTAVPSPPSTTVRIAESAIPIVRERGIEVVAAAAAREYAARLAAETQGVLFADESDREALPVGEDAGGEIDPPEPSPEVEEAEPARRWWEGVILDEEKGVHVDEVLATFLLRHLPRLREGAAEASDDVGADQAASLQVWIDQVRLFDEVRSTLDVLSPSVFTGGLSDLIAATAPEGSPLAASFSRREAKSLKRQAVELLRPGRSEAALHEGLVDAHHRAVRWRALCGIGGWPKVPEGLDTFRRRIDESWPLWTEIAPVVEAVTGRSRLAERTWEELQTTLESLTDRRRLPLEEAEVRDTQEHVIGLGMDVLFDELASRSVPPDRAALEIEFAWWASAFEAILAESPALAEHGAIGRAVDCFIDRDRDFAALRVFPLLKAVGERRRVVIARRQDDARDLFAILVEGGDGPFRDLWSRSPELVGALRPVVVCSADQVSDFVPSERVLDTVVLLGIESASFAELVPAISRSAQVIALGDSHAATRGAIPALRDVLPSLVLHAQPRPRDSRVTAVLSEHGYGLELESLPVAGGGVGLDVVPVDAVATPAPGAVGVQTTPAEVATVCALVAEREGRTVAVIAGNDTHALRLREALEEWDGGEHREVPVHTLGRAAGVSAEVVLLTLGYGPDTRGEYPERLGVLSSSLGAPAVRQALIASLAEVVVVTALPLEYLGWASRQGSEGHGVEALADLVALASAGAPLVRSAEGNWLFADLARRLRADATVHQRYGVGGDTIPLVVGLPGDEPSVAVVTDDVPPSPNASLRDQVRWQRSRLEALGWTVVPLFTLDVFMDPDAAADQVRAALGLAPIPDPVPDAAGVEVELIPSESPDDSDVGWGEDPDAGRDDELRRDRPPHR